jgi:hypothetical protein
MLEQTQIMVSDFVSSVKIQMVSRSSLLVSCRLLTEAKDVTVWASPPFAPESDMSELDDSVSVLHTLDTTAPSDLRKQPIFAEPALKPRPAPIYNDKHHYEYWAFLKSVPEALTTPSSTLSRCPSLMSGGTLSSRNSSTRSTKSSSWDSAEDLNLNIRTSYRISGCSDTSIPDASTHVQPLYTAHELSLLKGCPVKTCDHHLRDFARSADRKRHILKHFNGILECGFCTKDKVSFSQSTDRVNLFLTHLLKKHDAGLQSTNRTSFAGKLDTSSRKHSIEGPVASCSICTEPFSIHGFYEHLTGCVLREISRDEDSNDTSKNTDSSIDPDQSHEPTSSVEEPQDPFEYSSYLSIPSLSALQARMESGSIAELTASSRCLSLTSSQAVDSSEEETDWTEEQTSRESSPGASQLPRRLSPAKRSVVENIMQEFQRLFNQSLRTHTSGGHASSSSNGSNGTWSSNTSVYSASSFASRKRSLSGGGATPPNEDEESNKRRRPDGKAEGKKPVSDLRFACPYYKRNPGRHQTFTSCRDPGFTTVARLK